MNRVDPLGAIWTCVSVDDGVDDCSWWDPEETVSAADGCPKSDPGCLDDGIGGGGGGGGGGTPQTDKNGCLSPGVSGPPTPQCLAKSPVADLIAGQLAAYNQCVMSSTFKFDPEEIKIEKAEPPEGKNADMGVGPGDGLPSLPSNNEMFIETMNGCLKQFPLAALDTAFQGLPPGSVF